MLSSEKQNNKINVQFLSIVFQRNCFSIQPHKCLIHLHDSNSCQDGKVTLKSQEGSRIFSLSSEKEIIFKGMTDSE